MTGILQLALSSLNRLAAGMRRPALPFALLLTACTTVTPPNKPAVEPSRTSAPPVSVEQDALRALVAQQDRLYRVAAPLLVNNTSLCKSQARNLLGFTAKNKYSYSAEYVNAAQNLLGLDERLQVVGVLISSGAARSDVRKGDTLVEVEGKAMPEGENAERQAAIVLAPLVTGRSSVKMIVARGSSRISLNVPLTYACAFGIELGNTDNVTAYADGHRVLVTRGMMSFASTDEELAYVLAKEMAHNVLNHASKQHMNATIGGIIDNLARMHPDMSTMAGLSGVRPMPQELDAMADKLSLYMLARAGYNVDRAVAFWKKIANQYPASMLNAYTALHPATDYRITAMEKTVADIKAKQAARKPLMP